MKKATAITQSSGTCVRSVIDITVLAGFGIVCITVNAVEHVTYSFVLGATSIVVGRLRLEHCRRATMNLC